MADYEDDDLPPLEDFEEKLQKIRSKPANESEDYIGDYTQVKEEIKVPEVQVESQVVQHQKKDDKEFFGLKKGFLTSSPKKQEQVPLAKPKKEEIEYIKPKEPQKNPLEIKAVQDQMSMNTDFLKNSKSWLTQDLMEKLLKNPRLLQLFVDPKYSDFIKLIQSNPKEAQEKYGGNPEFNSLFKEFCTVMSGHFQGLAKEDTKTQEQTPSSNSQQTSSQEEKIQQLIQNDQEVQEILRDPQVIKVIQTLQQCQKIDFHSLMQKNDILAKKLKILISKGVLNIQSA